MSRKHLNRKLREIERQREFEALMQLEIQKQQREKELRNLEREGRKFDIE
jgi:hypothetical protein